MNDEKRKTMKISDERREVAARLRKTQGIKAFVESLGGIDLNGDWYWTDVSRRVADLIDPTCYVIGTTSQDWSDGSTVYTHDLSCGHTCRTDWLEHPAYCDECGARVVDDAF